MSYERRSSSHFQLFPALDPNDDDENANTAGPVKIKPETTRAIAAILDFVGLFPPELSDKLFAFLPCKDLMTCCQVSIQWRHVINNNTQWMNRCKQFRLVEEPLDETDPFKWTESATHVDSATLGRERRASPAFMLPPIASSRISSLCPWGRYFRQCHHLRQNWRQGRNVIHQMNVPDNKKGSDLCTCADSNSEMGMLAMGSNSGSVYLWSISGVPKLKETIVYSTVVEQVRLSENLLAILYQDGVTRAHKIPPGFAKNKAPMTLDTLFQFRIWALPTPNIQNEYTLFTQKVRDSLAATPRASNLQQITENPLTSNPNIQHTTETLSLASDHTVEQVDLHENSNLTSDNAPEIAEPNNNVIEPWLDSDYLASDLIFMITPKYLVVSGYACNCILLFGFDTKDFIKKIQVPQGVQACRNAFVSASAIYLTAKKRRMNQRFDTTISLFMYDFQEPFEFTEFRSQELTEEIRIDPRNADKIVWIAQDSIIYAANIVTQESIFVKASEAYVDSLIVHGERIVYHQYDGFVTALNWTGEVIWVTSASAGISRGFQCSSDFLITAKDGQQLSVYNVQSGELLHKIVHSPTRVEHLFIHDTKIICIGRDEPAVLIGYW